MPETAQEYIARILGNSDGQDGLAVLGQTAARLKALVDANVAAAEELHADDFQLVTPSGAAYTKDEYLGVSPRELSTTASGNRTRLTYVSAETRAVSDTTQS